MSDLFDLSGRVALVTGASQGLGRRFAQVLAAHGAAVALAARQVDKLEDLRTELHEAGHAAASAMLDVTDHGSIATAIDTIEATLGPIDILINNAGVAVAKGVLEQTEADWDRVLDTDLKGAFFTAQAVARRMVGRGGNIVNVASLIALKVVGHLAPYAAAKSGLAQLTKAMALELARHDIRVNALARVTSRPRSTAISAAKRAIGCASRSRSAASARPPTSTAPCCCSPPTRRAT